MPKGKKTGFQAGAELWDSPFRDSRRLVKGSQSTEEDHIALKDLQDRNKRRHSRPCPNSPFYNNAQCTFLTEAPYLNFTNSTFSHRPCTHIFAFPYIRVSPSLLSRVDIPLPFNAYLVRAEEKAAAPFRVPPYCRRSLEELRPSLKASGARPMPVGQWCQ